ncbi:MULTISPECIES: DUF559 domain-containing protein [unclassified Aeromicrobium]|uniref:DUF559 domain-containing protein n=1 Tax=unclassified Aeromicrobium TaxID=2633570 RepID=UPI00396B382F
MRPTPRQLRGRPFTTAEATAAGISHHRLRGPAFSLLHRGRGVWCFADEPRTLTLLLAADRLVLPPDAAISHLTGLHLHLPDHFPESPDLHTPRHWSTNTTAQTRSPDVILHRRLARLRAGMLGPLPVLSPERCLVDSAISLSQAEIVRFGDALVRSGRMTPEAFSEFAWTRHLHGVQRSRMTAWRMRERVGSFTETDARLVLSVCGMPEPETNGAITVDGRTLHGDLVLRRWKVVVEYDGWYHERSAGQRRIDIMRREALEAEGWLVIVLTADDLRAPATLVGRVWRALTSRGYARPAPRYARVELEELWRPPKPR